jgi:S1-C subfamily serine protease
VDACLRLLHRVAASTVTIAAEIPETNPSVLVLGTSRLGSGTVIDAGGLVLTVNYVVLGADRVTITDIRGDSFEGTVAAQDFASGVAAISVDRPAGFPQALPAGSSADLSTGEDVFTVASAGGEERRAASGIVTSLDPIDAYWEYRLDRSIASTCMTAGLGGAPLCDRFGNVVGVVSLSLGTIGRASLSIPAENFFDHSDELLLHGRRVTRTPRAWMGMFCSGISDQTVVAGLIPGGPGDRGGLRIGDVVVRVDGRPVSSRSQLYQQLWTHGPGETVSIAVYRDGAIATIDVESGDAEEFFA